ncbi:hypothetical protein HLB23_34010 [Nocardia uniformis]|uniref:Uncharacterized protein n=1 Tax=Nocardia uniformis TaxID=53432 RepID=A0A849CGG1_9NOCA|nr:hypothetical protein [Nocardia uniformis]NNH74809.1 hypothetical protein [Nocardia uniformis]
MMLMGFGPIILPLPRTNAAWFAGLLIAVLGFAIVIMLLVVTKCGDTSSTEPFPATSQAVQVTAKCEPFCGMTTGTGLPG